VKLCFSWFSTAEPERLRKERRVFAFPLRLRASAVNWYFFAVLGFQPPFDSSETAEPERLRTLLRHSGYAKGQEERSVLFFPLFHRASR